MDPDPGRRPADAGAFLAELRRASRSDRPPPAGHLDRLSPIEVAATGAEADDRPRSGDQIVLAVTVTMAAIGLALVAIGAVMLLG